MPNKIKTIYVVQHSHTDIGYTDLQEIVIDAQVENLRSVLRQFRQPGFDKHYRWVCETLFVVDRFLDRATKEEKTFFAFFEQMTPAIGPKIRKYAISTGTV